MAQVHIRHDRHRGNTDVRMGSSAFGGGVLILVILLPLCVSQPQVADVLTLAGAHVHACATHARDSLGAPFGSSHTELKAHTNVIALCANAQDIHGALPSDERSCPPDLHLTVTYALLMLAYSLTMVAECCPTPSDELSTLLLRENQAPQAPHDGEKGGDLLLTSQEVGIRTRELLTLSNVLERRARALAADLPLAEQDGALAAFKQLESARRRSRADALTVRFNGRCGWRSEVERDALALVREKRGGQALLLGARLVDQEAFRGAAAVFASLLLHIAIPDSIRSSAQQSGYALGQAGQMSVWLETLGAEELAKGAPERAAKSLVRALDSAPAHDAPRLEALVAMAHGALAAYPESVRRAEAEGRARNAASALRPEIALFAQCAHLLASELGLRPDWRAFIATDNTQVGIHLAKLLGEHAAFNASVVSRVDGFRERVGDKAQMADAMLDLAILARAPLFIGTHLSTFSMLAAGMADTPVHHMVYPARHARCALARSPFATVSPLQLAPEVARRGIYSWSVPTLLQVPCAAGEAAMPIGRALLAVMGDSGLAPMMFAATPEWRVAVAELRALVAQGGGALAGADADAPGALAAERRRELESVALLIKQHEARSARARRGSGGGGTTPREAGMGVAEGAAGNDEETPLRLLVAGAFAFNVGNRAMIAVAYVLMAMASGRALVLDGGLLPGLALPTGVDIADLPSELRARVLAAAGGNMRRSTLWLDNDEAMCEPLLPAECMEGASELCVAPLHAAPTPVFVVSNAQFREWYEQHVGYTGAGLRALMRWLLRPSAELERRADAAEVELCGSARGCDIGIHLRRGSTSQPDYFFPDAPAAAG